MVTTQQPPEQPPTPPSRWTDLERPPLREAALRRGLVGPECLWTSLEVIPSTRSTNSDLLDRLRAGAATGEGQVLVAEQQTAGRGRLGRGWQAPARSGLFFSVLLRPGPDVPVARFSWLPLLLRNIRT